MRLFRFVPGLVAATLMSLGPLSYGHEIDEKKRAAIDAHALAASPELESSSKSLAAYLAQDLPSDTEKVRAIYRWIGDRINYDVDAFLSGNVVAMSNDEVLKKRMSVCGGFASLFEELATLAGL
jgi:transglutaminase/protease-like cytokinesis protein 3